MYVSRLVDILSPGAFVGSVFGVELDDLEGLDLEGLEILEDGDVLGSLDELVALELGNETDDPKNACDVNGKAQG